MTQTPSELKYASSHEWARLEEDGTITVGISDHAQAALGDLVFVEIPEVGQTLAVGDGCAVVESVKAASDVYAPVAGNIAAVNDDLADDPEKINADPYGDGWIVRMNVDGLDESVLMTPDDYQQLLDELDD